MPRSGWVTAVVGSEHVCGLDAKGALSCRGWGSGERLTTYVHEAYREGRVTRETRRFPKGPLVSIGGRTDAVTCALGRDGVVTCFGPATRYANWEGPPDGRLRQMGANPNGSTFCGVIEPAGEAVCWGINGSRLFETLHDAPPGPYTRVEVRDFQACGVRPDGGIACWGNNACDASVLGTGPVEQLALANAGACVRRTGEPVRCCGSEHLIGEMPADAELVDLTAGLRSYCGLRPDGGLACWGDGAHMASNRITPLPEGRFRTVRDAGGARALRSGPRGAPALLGRADRRARPGLRGAGAGR